MPQDSQVCGTCAGVTPCSMAFSQPYMTFFAFNNNSSSYFGLNDSLTCYFFFRSSIIIGEVALEGGPGVTSRGCDLNRKEGGGGGGGGI